jgi:DNA (cytosine-5)-methyltransferase 1
MIAIAKELDRGNFVKTTASKNILQREKLIDVRDIVKARRYKVVALFSGCGGFSLGFQGGFKLFSGINRRDYSRNPFKVIWSNDISEHAINTYKSQFKSNAVCADIRSISSSDIPDCDIVIGGFPCQDFSISGKMQGFKTLRGKLYKELVRVIQDKNPIAFVAENVKNIQSLKLIDEERKQTVFQTILEDFSNCGYDVSVKLIYGPDYGLPQKRERIFFVGLRKDLGKSFYFPASHHSMLTSKDAIDDLWGLENKGLVANHDQCSLAKFKPPSKSGNQGNYKLNSNEPSYVMRAEHHMNIQAHYRSCNESDPENRDYWRRLTVREAARLQGFPDDFVFLGSKIHTYSQVGNAVPPILSWYIARALYNSLNQ